MDGTCVGRAGPTIAEMSGEGLLAPAVAIIDGSHKYVYCEEDPPLLFDRATDPQEIMVLMVKAAQLW